jgi:hypothetical protein
LQILGPSPTYFVWRGNPEFCKSSRQAGESSASARKCHGQLHLDPTDMPERQQKAREPSGSRASVRSDHVAANQLFSLALQTL